MKAGVYGRQSRGSKKSIKDQINAGHLVVKELGWELVETYSDEVSASRYGGKARAAWDQVLADITAGAFEVLVLWESSRGDRRLTSWSALLDSCRERGVRIHIVSHERTYNLANHRDWETLATDGVKSESEVNLLSTRVRRGVAAAARDGRPAAGPCPYGYRRTYDPTTGALTGQVPEPATAAVVREIVQRVAASVPVSEIARDLNARAVPPPAGKQWYRQRVRLVALNRAYLGLRKHKDAWHPAGWPALVDADTFYAATRVLSDPARTTRAVRPGRQKHLLTYYATCAKHGGNITGSKDGYTCRLGCLVIKMAPVDALIEELVLARLADPLVYTALRQAAQAGDAEVQAARSEAAVLRERLEEWRKSAARGQTTPETMAAVEAELVPEIAALTAKAEAATVPAALAGWLGGPAADVAARWAVAGVAAKRSVLRALGLRVVLSPAGRNSYRPVHERVTVEWSSPA